MPLVRIDWVVIESLRSAKGLPAIGAAGKHHVGPTEIRCHASNHIDVIVSSTAGTVHCNERLPTESYSIYSALNEIATQVDLSDLIKSRCLTSILCIAGTHAPKRGPTSGEKKVAIGVHRHCPGIGRVGNIDRTQPGCPAVSGTVEFAEVASEKACPKLVDESMAHAPNIR